MAGRGKNRTYYHYKITDNNTGESELFRTCQDITNKFGICRATIYNMVNRETKRSRKNRNITIEQFYQPIE